MISNLIWNTPVMDYVKAAKENKIPTVLIVASWDNLTTKSTFHVVPDAVLVWNEALAKEAMILHNVPREKIVVTGAQTFDYLFELQPSSDYFSFCKKVGISTDKEFIVYLGSSDSISGDETNFFTRFADGLDAHNDVSILLRPHPFNYKIWENYRAPNIVVWPREGKWPDTTTTKQDLYDTIYHCKAVVGVNTSAMLEAAIVNRPCVTIMTDTHRASQAESGHFQHLLVADFLETASSFSEANDIIGRILEGQDTKANQRHKFVRSFIRPRGLHNPPGEIVACVIESIAQGKSVSLEEKL